jgi:hypothetical protein
MHRILFPCLTLLLSISLTAQPQRGLKGTYNTSKHPEISFVWNSPNPNILEKKMFTLTDENGQNIDFDVSALPKENKTYKKSVLFLWEDMRSHRNQSEDTRDLLANFFNSTAFDQSTEFNVAVFNRKSDREKSVLRPLLSDFTSNTDELAFFVASYEKSSRVFREKEHPLQTDLYLAINEGINMLKAEPANRIGVIIVVTAGLNMKAAGANTEMETVRKNATEAGIPIYVVKYHQLAGNAPEVNTLAESTYGKTILLTHNKVNKAVAGLQNLYKNLDTNCAGQDYQFTFNTTAKRDGQPHPIRLSVNKVNQPIPELTIPSRHFGTWVKEHVFLSILLLVLLTGIIVSAIWLIVRNIKDRRRREAESKELLQQKIDQEKRDRQNWEDQQQLKENERRRAEQRKVRMAEENRLLQLMRTKNTYPRLQCHVEGDSFCHTVDKVVTKLGRHESNDVVLPSKTVSGVHADIVFNGTSFEIVNRSRSYWQGLIVNGKIVQKHTLQNGDKIGLGDAIITFCV